jgi:DNA-binding winged helix-turn-helix (wHTH) protein
MPGSHHPRTVISFGPFEADLQTQELRKHGVRLHLPGQSFQILKILLERPGELATREELHKALWPSETFVDFEHGVNAAVNRLREALGDSADNPHLIETLPRRGYRFIGVIAPTPSASGGSSESGVITDASQNPVPVKDRKQGRLNWMKLGTGVLAGAICALAVFFAYLKFRTHAEPATLTAVPFMAYPGLERCPAFSPDGSQIVFEWGGDPSRVRKVTIFTSKSSAARTCCA